MMATSGSNTMIIEPQESILSLQLPPQKSIPHTYPYGASPSIELQPVTGGRTLNEYPNPRSPPAIEHAQSHNPVSVFDEKQTCWKPYMNRFRVLGCCLTGFANGMNDSAPGALISSIET
jgi:hypothetical protein